MSLLFCNIAVSVKYPCGSLFANIFFSFVSLATAPQVIVPDSKLIQHMNASSITVRLEHGAYVGFSYLI